MIHYFNTRQNNSDFSKEEIDAVWKKGRIILGTDPNLKRNDICGTVILKSAYGNIKSSMGWEIDHIKPVSKGGSDDLSNLQPLYWDTNRKKADIYPWFCSML